MLHRGRTLRLALLPRVDDGPPPAQALARLRGRRTTSVRRSGPYEALLGRAHLLWEAEETRTGDLALLEARRSQVPSSGLLPLIELIRRAQRDFWVADVRTSELVDHEDVRAWGANLWDEGALGHWWALWPRWGAQYLTVRPDGPGRPRLGPWRTPDGRAVVEVISDGRLDTLDHPVWMSQAEDSRGTRRGDLLWIGGLPICIASTRLVDLVTSLGVTGLSSFEIPVRERRGEPVDGYVGVLADVTGTSEVVSPFWAAGRQCSGLVVSDRVLASLRAAGIDAYWVEPWTVAGRVPTGPSSGVTAPGGPAPG